jgi:hypothetical protein
MKTEEKRHLGRVPLSIYLPRDLANILKAKAERASLSPATWVRQFLSESFALEIEQRTQRQQQMYAQMMRQQGGAQ